MYKIMFYLCLLETYLIKYLLLYDLNFNLNNLFRASCVKWHGNFMVTARLFARAKSAANRIQKLHAI